MNRFPYLKLINGWQRTKRVPADFEEAEGEPYWYFDNFLPKWNYGGYWEIGPFWGFGEYTKGLSNLPNGSGYWEASVNSFEGFSYTITGQNDTTIPDGQHPEYYASNFSIYVSDSNGPDTRTEGGLYSAFNYVFDVVPSEVSGGVLSNKFVALPQTAKGWIYSVQTSGDASYQWVIDEPQIAVFGAYSSISGAAKEDTSWVNTNPRIENLTKAQFMDAVENSYSIKQSTYGDPILDQYRVIMQDINSGKAKSLRYMRYRMDAGLNIILPPDTLNTGAGNFYLSPQPGGIVTNVLLYLNKDKLGVG